MCSKGDPWAIKWSLPKKTCPHHSRKPGTWCVLKWIMVRQGDHQKSEMSGAIECSWGLPGKLKIKVWFPLIGLVWEEAYAGGRKRRLEEQCNWTKMWNCQFPWSKLMRLTCVDSRFTIWWWAGCRAWIKDGSCPWPQSSRQVWAKEWLIDGRKSHILQDFVTGFFSCHARKYSQELSIRL